MTSAVHRQYAERFRAPESQLAGAGLPWLDRLREEAMSRFESVGFPSPREEDWKYTNVAPIQKKLFRARFDAPAAPEVDHALLDSCRLPGCWNLVFVDGWFVPELSVLPEPSGEGAIFSLRAALEHQPERVEAMFGRAVARERHGFIDFNTAFFGDGAFVRIAAGQRVEKPLHLVYVATQAEGLASVRNLVVLEPGSQLRLLETYVGLPGQPCLTASVTEVSVGENAALDAYTLQRQADRAVHFGGIYADVARHGRFDHFQLSTGGFLVRNEVHAELALGAECGLNGLFLGRRRQHVDNHTLIHHREPRGVSREHYRGILSERARGVFQGRIVVHPAAQKTDANMSNRNLLLSEDAEIDAKPQLEIHADDVKCGHGVAIGQLDPEALFYLQSRGVDAISARNTLTFAFAHTMCESLRWPELKALVQEELLSLFPQSGIRRDWL